MIAALGQDRLDPVFLANVAFAQELDFDPVLRCNSLGIFTQRVAEWLGDLG
jgi:hypothetical protein